jgi:radical SAM superfamily enzyme YgiQ (UPF0313 family)
MKVVLSTPPGKTSELWPPLGLLYLASSVRTKRPDDVKVIDAFCENLDTSALVSRVLSERPDVFGMNCSTHTFLDTVDTLAKVKAALPSVKLVLGGIHATLAGERILESYPFVDYLVKGEGELSFPRLLDRIERGVPPSDVEGISWLDGGRIVGREPVLIEDLDSLPFPDRSLADEVEYGYYHKNIRLTFGKFTTISSSRGCPYQCTYCSCAAFSQRRWRPRSPENVVAELEKLQGDGYESVVFVDDNLTHNTKRMLRICDLIKERKVDLRFYCEGRVSNASYELMRTMKQAGFDVMYFGVESPHKHVLDYYNKTIDPAQAAKAVENARKAGMIVVTSFIVGAPVESQDDIDRTVEFIRQLRPHAVQINILDCLIGTEIWNSLERDRIPSPDDWKTNHRIYEYFGDRLSREELENSVNQGYAAHLDTWKSAKGLASFARTLLANKTARDIVMGNLFSADARKRLMDGTRYERRAGTQVSQNTAFPTQPSGSSEPHR